MTSLTISRLNRAHPKKRDTLVLDVAKDTDSIYMLFDLNEDGQF
jgi:type I site-specific restriction-modification system R (restriction) subunit